MNAADAAVDIISKDRDGQQNSYHKAPPMVSSRHIDSRIASQMGIGAFAAEVLFAGIGMTFVVVFEVVLCVWFFHGVILVVG